MLPSNVQVQGTNPSPGFANPNRDQLPTVDIQYFILEASDQVDSLLSMQYDTPLRQTNSDGFIGYPKPIPYITSVLAAQMIYSQILQGAEKQFSEAQKDREKLAYDQIKEIKDGIRRLRGQRNRFYTGDLYNKRYGPPFGGGESSSKG
jgi:hypothetical protein